MAFTPNTIVRLLNVPLENNYKNQLYFNSVSAQTSYMNTKVIKQYNGLHYQRKDNVIRVPEHIDNLWNVNYVMYKNSNFNDKWFYAFITKMEYINDGRTDVYIETDVWQTWFNQITLKESFVEREHVMDDTIGKNTVPENLETGEYVSDLHETDSTIDNVLNDLCYIIGATSQPLTGEAKDTPSGSDLYNGIYSGVKYYRYDTVDAIDIVLEIYANSGKSDSITGIFMIPKALAPLKENTVFREVNTSSSPNSYTINKDKNVTTIDGYTPKNKKLLCYPYNFLNVSNNNGGAVTYLYENFSTNDCEFDVKGAICPGGSIRLTPKNYKGAIENDEESLNLGKFPICNYTTDMYTNWLTQNSVNIGLSMANSAISIVGGIGMMATGGGALAGAGAVVNGGMAIANTLGQVHQHALIPPQANGNINCGDVITSDSKNTFHFYKMCIKQEYAKIIDKYFDMFGYKVNMVKVPNISGRSKWNYVKTIDCNLDGNIPQDDLQKVKSMFDNGITFWKNASEIENYSLNNSI